MHKAVYQCVTKPVSCIENCLWLTLQKNFDCHLCNVHDWRTSDIKIITMMITEHELISSSSQISNLNTRVSCQYGIKPTEVGKYRQEESAIFPVSLNILLSGYWGHRGRFYLVYSFLYPVKNLQDQGASGGIYLFSRGVHSKERILNNEGGKMALRGESNESPSIMQTWAVAVVVRQW